MYKLREWLESWKKRRFTEYEETKKEFEKIMGKPAITITVELPEGVEDLRERFLRLEKDENFLKAVEKLAEKHLKRKKSPDS